MKVKLIFDAPDELAGVALEPQDFLRMYNERMLGIRLDGIEIPNAYDRAICNLADKLGGKAVILVANSDECKCLMPDAPGVTDVAKIKAHVEALQREVVELTQVKKQEAIALQPYEMPDVRPIFDDRERREAKERRQQHKFTVKFSNKFKK